MKNFLILFLIFTFMWPVYGQSGKVISGSIEKVSEDGSYIIVSGQKIITTKDFVEEAYFEVGDKVMISVVFGQEGNLPTATSYEYNFDEELDYDDSGDETNKKLPDSELSY